MTEVVRRLDPVLLPDPSRVVASLFVPGHDQVSDEVSRATGVLARILDMPEDAVAGTLAGVRRQFSKRHRDFEAVLCEHARRIDHRIPDGSRLSADRRSLLGAYFTHEFSVEAAALFNPSAVAHPDQSGLADGEVRFILSLRAVGEGHVSSVEFRTGVLGPAGALTIDDPGPFVERGAVSHTTMPRALLAVLLRQQGADTESTRFLLSRLPELVTYVDLGSALAELEGQRVTRHGGPRTEELARHILSGSYQVTFNDKSALAERVLWPESPAESHGLEDVRFVQFTDADGAVDYRATYTAFDGQRITPQTLQTADFRTFTVGQLAGEAATNKGMALFPRLVRGRHLALSRWDRENCSITSSPDGLVWDNATTVHVPQQPWELIQTGNCGSPLETSAGWVVLTHGVGPMRQYVLGALLLDLEHPTTVLGSLTEPLLSPAADEREGYVPNVVYSCGGLLHDGQLLLPYGASDSSVRFATVEVEPLVSRLLSQ